MTLPPGALDLSRMARIAVLRANAMGDYLLAEPALAALRAAAPQARITFLGGPFAAGALAGRPGPVDEVLLVPPLPGLRPARPGEDEDGQAFFTQMRSRRFDLALQLHGGGRNSNPVVLGLGARVTAGLRAFDAPGLDIDISYQYWQHEVFKYLEVMQALGAAPVRTQPRFDVLASDRAEAARVLGALETEPGGFAVLHPGATDPRRRWPAAHFAQVADALASRGLDVLVVGTGDEAPVVQDVVRRARDASPLLDLPFPALVGVLAGARLLVGNDSGPRHLADAVGTPTVSVYWCGNMLNAGPVGRDRHRAHIAWSTACPDCGISTVGEPFPDHCSDNVSHVSDVPVASVVSGVDDLLEVDRGDWA